MPLALSSLENSPPVARQMAFLPRSKIFGCGVGCCAKFPGPNSLLRCFSFTVG